MLNLQTKTLKENSYLYDDFYILQIDMEKTFQEFDSDNDLLERVTHFY